VKASLLRLALQQNCQWFLQLSRDCLTGSDRHCEIRRNRDREFAGATAGLWAAQGRRHRRGGAHSARDRLGEGVPGATESVFSLRPRALAEKSAGWEGRRRSEATGIGRISEAGNALRGV